MGGEGDDRGWDGWMASPTQWTWVWVSSGSWWWTGKSGVLQSMGSQRVRHDWVTELNWCVFVIKKGCLQILYFMQPNGKHVCLPAQLLSHVWLFATPWTVAHQIPLPMGFSGQEYWSELPWPSPRGSSQPRDGTCISYISCIVGRFFTTSTTWEAQW